MHEDLDSRKRVEELLASWDVEAPVDPCLKSRVLRRIQIEESSREDRAPFSRLVEWLASHPMLASGMACMAIVAVGFVGLVAQQRVIVERSHDYFVRINPVAHVDMDVVGTAPTCDDSVIDMLAWMRGHFDLTKEQFSALVDLHMGYEDRLMSLYAELGTIERGYRGYELSRVNNEQIDFMALYDLLSERDRVRADSIRTSRQLVELVMQVLTPDQRLRYLALLNDSGTLHFVIPESPKSDAGA
jgi:hypothetical protein